MFENIHRFAGWTAVILFWAQLVVLMDFERHGMAPMPSLSSLLVRNPSFWLLIAISLFLIGPWLQLKKVNVHPEYLSNHAIRLHFTYANLSLCTALRFSTSPLREWHAFAGIPAKSGQGFSVVVSHAGDWTKSMISDPPTHLWTRGFPTKGVLNIAPVFKSVVLVATGSGIGPILSLITARNIPCRIVWSTPTPQTTYQQEIVDDVYRADPQAIIIDTTRFGRPDLVHVSYEAFNDFGAEAVFIISNPKVTRKVVYGLESRGVPIFAPIFDS
ncbi:putative amino acid adenylation domain-containing protein [Phaeomoniella chlamydospora]|uniref:Putative amino acid adenylation domain-containing protein n=1 Tax=Phaeomoniella chlamydospora TaxID=158046 RepID=A0A0G2F3L4_PHACM|nr:putative amino acid adenylation domain-containing protein [Phaeomoniella chlamydospora]